MRISTQKIPDGSHGFRVYHHLPQSDEHTTEPYQVTGCFERIDDTTCEVTGVMGDLTPEVNVAVGLEAIRLGYKTLRFRRSMGGLATRWAVLVREADGLDYYVVDLEEAIAIYRGRG